MSAALLLSGCAPAQPSPAEKDLHTYSNIAPDAGFDTILSYQEAVEDKADFDARFSEAVSLFTYYNDLFDIYHEYDKINNLYTVNQNAGIAPVKVSGDIIDMLKKAKSFYEISDGKFDVTMGRMLAVWHEYRTEGVEKNLAGEGAAVPDAALLSEAAARSGWDFVEIDEEESTVFITEPGISLDVGGIAKGYATEMIARKLSESGELPGAINAGGNNRTLGMKYNGQAWRVGIQDPDGEGSLLIVQQEGACSFVTSGDYERFYVGEDGRKYHHIIDPDTMYPADHFRSVSIITPDSADADALSTTLFTMTYEEGLKMIQAYKELYPGRELEVVWISDSGSAPESEYSREKNGLTILYTEGLKDRLIFN